jgi:hypothetical protein
VMVVEEPAGGATDWIAATASTRPKPDCEFQLPLGVPFIGSAVEVKDFKICTRTLRVKSIL